MSTVASPKNTKFQIRATDINNQSVRTPFAKEPIPLRLDFDCHPELARISNWDSELKKHVERACFASYQDQVEMTGRQSLPTIRRANQIWKHIAIKHVRIDPTAKNAIVFYVVPEWDESEHMEWCIKKGKLVYVGQYLGYDVNGYNKRTPCNFA